MQSNGFQTNLANGGDLLCDNATPEPAGFGQVREHGTPVQMVTATATALRLWPKERKSAEETLKTACLSLSLNPNLNLAARLLRWAMRRKERTDSKLQEQHSGCSLQGNIEIRVRGKHGDSMLGTPRGPPAAGSFGGVVAAAWMLSAGPVPGAGGPRPLGLGVRTPPPIFG